MLLLGSNKNGIFVEGDQDTGLPWDIVLPFENPVSYKKRANCRQIQVYNFFEKAFKDLPYCAIDFFENGQKIVW